MNLPRVIAKQAHDAAFLIETREDGGRRYGRIYDATRDEVFREMLIGSIVAMCNGGWFEFEGSEEERTAIEDEVRERLA